MTPHKTEGTTRLELGQVQKLQFLPGFVWAVGPFFSETLKACYFESAGVYYSDRSAYGPWPGNDRHFDFFQVTQSDGSTSLSFAENWKRSTTIKFFEGGTQSRYIETDQGTLYELLWGGSLDVLNPECGPGDAPLGLGVDLRRHIDRSLIEDAEILVPVDLAHVASIWKLRSMAGALNQISPFLIPAQTYFPDHRVKPTVFVGALKKGQQGLARDAELVRQAISPDAVRFKLSAHAFFQQD